MRIVRAKDVPPINKPRKPVPLDQRYGAIGISAVVAALRFSGAQPCERLDPSREGHEFPATELDAAKGKND